MDQVVNDFRVHERIPSYTESELQSPYLASTRSSSPSRAPVHHHPRPSPDTDSDGTNAGQIYRRIRSLIQLLPFSSAERYYTLDDDDDDPTCSPLPSTSTPYNHGTTWSSSSFTTHSSSSESTTVEDTSSAFPPPYEPLNPHQSTFLLSGTSIHSPTAPAYQLSAPLSMRGGPLRIRRLHAADMALISTHAHIRRDSAHTAHSLSSSTQSCGHGAHSHAHMPMDTLPDLTFDASDALYSVDLASASSSSSDGIMCGHRGSRFPGTLELKIKLNKWVVVHRPRPSARAYQILKVRAMKRGSDTVYAGFKRDHGDGRRKGSVDSNRSGSASGCGDEERRLEWKDSRGRIVALEGSRRMVDATGLGVGVPVIELSAELDRQWRELILSLWAARLWVSVCKEKSALMGD